GGDVLQAWQEVRIVVRTMAVVAHQRATGALRVVELGLREPVVEKERNPPRQRLSEAAHERARMQLNFRAVVVCGKRQFESGAQYRVGRRRFEIEKPVVYRVV